MDEQLESSQNCQSLANSCVGKHFYDHNILSHIRTTSRTDTKGRKILFIEEVQSDWHQSGKRNGYDNSCWGQVVNAPYKKEWPVLAVKLMLVHASQNGFAGVAWPRGSVQEMRYMRNLQSIKRYYDKDIPKALNPLVKNFNCKVEVTHINTREPWLNIEKNRTNGKLPTVMENLRQKQNTVIATMPWR